MPSAQTLAHRDLLAAQKNLALVLASLGGGGDMAARTIEEAFARYTTSLCALVLSNVNLLYKRNGRTNDDG